jgi:hypothetical protein
MRYKVFNYSLFWKEGFYGVLKMLKACLSVRLLQPIRIQLRFFTTCAKPVVCKARVYGLFSMESSNLRSVIIYY